MTANVDNELLDAAKAVLARWDNPLLKLVHGESIDRLRRAIAKVEQSPAETLWFFEAEKGQGVYQGLSGPDAENLVRQVTSECPEAGQPFCVPVRWLTEAVPAGGSVNH
jgi:hypothetical protein